MQSPCPRMADTSKRDNFSSGIRVLPALNFRTRPIVRFHETFERGVEKLGETANRYDTTCSMFNANADTR